MSVPFGQFDHLPEYFPDAAFLYRKAVDEDPVAVVDLLLVGVLRVHLEELHLVGIDLQVL